MSKAVSWSVTILVVLVAVAGGGWYVIRRANGNTLDAGRPNEKKTPGPVPVGAIQVKQRDIPVYLDGLGTVQAYQAVLIRPQVDGQIKTIAFKEGQDLHVGDLVAQLDAQPLQAQLDQSVAHKKQDEAKKSQDEAKIKTDEAKVKQDEAKVKQDEAKKAQDEANVANARVNLKRLIDTQIENAAAVSQQSIDDQKSTVTQLDKQILADEAAIQADQAGRQADEAVVVSDQAAVQSDVATIQSDEAAIKYSQSQLAYTTITSPIDGRAGIRLVDVGNIAHVTDQTGIVLITQMQPISVIFTLPQQYLISINGKMSQGKLSVIANSTENTAELDHGELQLVDNQIDPTTGTIKLKATFPNTQRRLWPGGFVNVRLLLETRKNANVIPATAIQQGPHGTFVYAIKPDLTVETRDVTVGFIQDGQALIESGLTAGEQVVLSGQDRLKPGAHISINPGRKGKNKADGSDGDGANKDVSSKPKEPQPESGSGAPK